MDNTRPVVIVTGAARGIGRVIGDMYWSEGALVAGVDRDWDVPSPTEASDVLRITCDVRVPEEIETAIDHVVKHWGRIDVLINNAGFGIWKHPRNLTVEDWDAVLDTNLRGTFLFSRAAAEVMGRNEPSSPTAHRGSIVNIASTRALMSEANSEAYAASKGGVVALTHALAASYAGDRIRVNCISPGWIETGDYGALSEEDHRQHWAGRVGTPSDVASACRFLTAGENGFITGTNLVVDGGMTRTMMYRE